MSKGCSVSKHQALKAQIQVFSKEQFNYKRNNSVLMSTCLSWNWLDQQNDYIEEKQNVNNRSLQLAKQSNSGICQQECQKLDRQKNLQQQNVKKQQRSKTRQNRTGVGKSKGKVDFSKFQKSQEQIFEQKQKEQQRRQKIKDYIQSMVPYSRTLTNSKFQQFYQRSAPQAYGNANTTQPIGGVIYGNNLRTFNVNPHDYQNNPQYYQSFNTSLNFATRCKRDSQKHWKRLQKQLGKKLNLHEKNHALQQGKQMVYVDVNDENMYQTMKENLQFKKQHKGQIRQSEQNYEYQKDMKSKAQRQKFYRNKAEKIQENLQKTNADTLYNQRQTKNRISEQVIYKLHDKDGNVRIGADRHALTCFVDTNFPQNEQLYIQQLKKRGPIYPTQVQDRHKNLAEKKRFNFQKSLSNVYPSHYLLPCNEQPQILNMLIQRGSQSVKGKQIK